MIQSATGTRTLQPAKVSAVSTVSFFLFVLLQLHIHAAESFMLFANPNGSSSSGVNNNNNYLPELPMKVLVTGASGRTGQLVLEALLSDPEHRFLPKALVRSVASGKKLRKAVPNVGLDQIVVCDVTTLSSSDNSNDNAFDGVSGLESHAMVICTSAVPVISRKCLIKAFFKIPFNMLRGQKPVDFRTFKFVWKQGQYPEQVDYYGQIAQFELAKKLGVKHVVLVSSMGGTDPSNFLNSVGKNPDGTGHGDILLWKRKAERYLVEQCPELDYTIIHPGGLLDTPGGQRRLILDVDDRLLAEKSRSISRADVANLCVASLMAGAGQKVSFDCISKPVEEGATVESAEGVMSEFLKQAKTCNYAL